MTDETCGRVVAHPNIIAVLDLPGRHFAAGRLSLNSTAMLKMPPGFNSEIVSKRGSGQFRKLDHKNCLKTGVHSIEYRLNCKRSG
ncbi:MAG: hypothetical protein DMG76_34790 [Acidobacteria bacterium]|nr:MAG: hypothetical protein DMG76_34790 [Acidobacteriota bacterium]